ETFYVLLVAPRTFYLYNVRRELQAGIHIENGELVDLRTNERHEATDANFRRLFSLASYQDSESQPQLRLFRKGELASGYIPITGETLPLLEQAFSKSIDELKYFCKTYFETLQAQYQKYSEQKAELEVQIENAGGDNRSRRFLREKLYRLNFKHRVHRQLFEHDYPNFEEAQAYSGTESKKDFQDVFITNTAYIALSRLIFVRLAEDIGLTEKRISNAGMAVWKQILDELRHYQDIIDFTFKQVEHLYNRLFEESAFDWYGKGNGELSRILERILFRLNAFSFNNVNRDILGTMYQSFRPRIERKRLGEYYTADAVVDFILKQTGITTDPLLLSKKILDPACGSFTFGVRATLPILEKAAQLSAENKLEVVRNVLYGADINAFSVFLSHLSLFFVTLDLYMQARKQNPAYRVFGFNLATQNSLIDLHTTQMGTGGHSSADSDEAVSMPMEFDYIVGNPPFVRNERLPEFDRSALREIFKDIWRKNPDLSLFFIFSMLRFSLKKGGTMGFVLPIGIANADYATPLRQFLFNSLSVDQQDRYSLTHLVSLEWMAKEIFPDADIIPMLLFVRKERPSEQHQVKITSGLRSLEELHRATVDEDFLARHTSAIPYDDFKTLSPTGDWCLEVTQTDIPILKALRAKPTLSRISKTSFAIKVGSKGGSAIQPLAPDRKTKDQLYFGKGQNILAFGLGDAEEVLDLNKKSIIEDASIWDALDVFKKDEHHGAQMEMTEFSLKPSDSFVCAIPEVTPTLNATVFSPLKWSFNNSCLVTVPTEHSAYTVSAIINSLPSRYFAFMTLRSSILLRRRTTWFPRTINNLPLPDLTEETAKALHDLSVEAHKISESASLTPEDKFL
ncbi:MAG: SAM-dependent DNA methyltransferase, partial [Chlorobiales bacterium]|nr:SAM-dependent DNA methyltransferase [Chlorobiales bacterium]